MTALIRQSHMDRRVIISDLLVEIQQLVHDGNVVKTIPAKKRGHFVYERRGVVISEFAVEPRLHHAVNLIQSSIPTAPPESECH